MDIGTNDSKQQHWVDCTMCEYSSGYASDEDTATKRWNGTAPAQVEEDKPVSSLDVVSSDELFKQKLIDVLLDISKSLKTLVSKR
jgi:hypothetical protein